ncbi:keratin 98 [Pseudorasbora parva]|uniref:keratin 98 n=1 Tax=Pseudorasbora parva TaxID=51549 RepID=UPI00351F1A1E
MSFPYKSRATSVYGGAGGRGTRISLSPARFLRSSPGSFNLGDALDLPADEKTTMQNLNTRLASYLDKVRSLEKANADLERNIKEWYESHTYATFDHTVYQDTIKSLRKEIQSVSQENASIVLAIDNAKLASDDFKLKYENELAMRRVIDADIANLRKILDDFSLSRSDLEMQIESLKEELIILKRRHEEEMSEVSAEVGGQVNVCVDAAPSMDLMQGLNEIRQHYETMTEKNRQELESWYESKISTVQQEVVTQNEDLQYSRTELKELTSTLHKLQIELQTLKSTRSALDGELEDKQARYGDQLARLQVTVTGLEDQLSQFHANIGKNKQEYETLLDIKSRLEREIAEYRRLLDGDKSESRKIFTKTTTVETVLNGKVVESCETMDVNEEND